MSMNAIADQEKNQQLAAILAFRDRMYRDPKPGTLLPVSVAAFALLGSHFKYPTCCILHFCELAWDGVTPNSKAKEVDGRTLCPKCLASKKETTEWPAIG